jgi:hypothetical protein
MQLVTPRTRRSTRPAALAGALHVARELFHHFAANAAKKGSLFSVGAVFVAWMESATRPLTGAEKAEVDEPRAVPAGDRAFHMTPIVPPSGPRLYASARDASRDPGGAQWNQTTIYRMMDNRTVGDIGLGTRAIAAMTKLIEEADVNAYNSLGDLA